MSSSSGDSSDDEGLPAFNLGAGPSKVVVAPCRVQVTEAQLIDEMPSAVEQKMERKRRNALAKRKSAETRKAEREQQLADKRQKKQIEKAEKQALVASCKEDQPSERLKLMVVILDIAISENAAFMAALVTEFKELGVEYRISKDMLPPGSIIWKRKQTDRRVDENAQIVHTVSEEEQEELLVNIEAQAFVSLVHYTREVEAGQSIPPGAKTLKEFVDDLTSQYPQKRVTLLVEGLESFLRGNKTHKNRRFRQAVTGNTQKISSRTFSDINRLHCEEVVVDVQLCTGCVLLMCETGDEMAEQVVTMTKAISESHYRQTDLFSFYADSGQGPSRQALQRANSEVSLLFKHQLMQFNNLSECMAAAVVDTYPSPALLMTAYESCKDEKRAQQLLKDIEVRRGVGVVSSTRKLGPTHSKRIYTFFNSTNSQLTLD